jgi:hypothetical protein
MKEINHIRFRSEKISGALWLSMGLSIFIMAFHDLQELVISILFFLVIGAPCVWIGIKQLARVCVTSINPAEGYVEQRWGIFRPNKSFRLDLTCFSEVFINLDDRLSETTTPQNYGVCLVGRNMIFKGRTVKNYYLYITPHQEYRKAQALAQEISDYAKIPFDSDKKPDFLADDFKSVTSLK